MRLFKVLQRITVMITLTATMPALASGNREIIEKIAELNKPLQQELAIALSRDPRLQAEVDVHRSKMRNVLTDKSLTESERQRLALELNRRIEPTVKTLFRKARIDERNHRRTVEEALRRIASKKGRRLHTQYLGYLGWAWEWITLINVYQPPRADREVTLSVPFPLVEEELNGLGEVSTEPDFGTYRASSRIVLAGAHENIAGLAHFFEVDDNYDRIEASIALPETRYELNAFSEVLGVYGAYASSRIEIFANNQVICSESVEHAGIVAPVLYFAGKRGVDNIIASCDILAPEQGDEIVLKGESVAGVWGGGLGSATSLAEGRPRDLRLMLEF